MMSGRGAASVAGPAVLCLVLLLATTLALLPAAAESGEALRLQGDLQRLARPPAAGDWRLRLRLESGLWEGGAVLRRRDGELGAAPHRAWWVACRLPAGWRLDAGHQQVRGAAGVALGMGRGGLPGRVAEGWRLAPGSASRSVPEERGLALSRLSGPTRGGLLVADTRRDRRLDGSGFVLDLEHREARRERLGAWRDRLALAWLTQEGPGGWDLHLAAGRRRHPLGAHPLGGLTLQRRHPALALALAAETGEGRLLRLQAASQARGGRWQADLWQGREGPSRWARPLLPLGRGAGGGGLWLQGDRRWGGLDARAALRWLDGPVRSEDRSAWWWRLELAGRLRESGLRWRVQRTAAADLPAGAGLDAWRLGLEHARVRGLDWSLAWEQQRRPAGPTRHWHLKLRREGRGEVRAGWQLQVLAGAGQGPSRPVALGLAPGLLRHSWLRGGRLAWGGGWWRRSPGGHLEAACLLEESRSDAGDSGRSLLLHVGLGWDIR